jgi:hypothetical protein
MENPEQGIGKSSKKENFKIILQWIGMNFLGWVLASLFGYQYSRPGLFLYISNIYGWNTISISSIFGFIFPWDNPFAWFPLGIWLGIMQALYLRKWKIPFFRWLLATSLGIGLTLFVWENIDYRFLIHTDNLSTDVYCWLILVLAGSAFMGWMQYLLLRKHFTKSFLWIVYTIVGYIAWSFAFEFTMMAIMIPETPEVAGAAFVYIMDILTLIATPFVSVVPSIFTGLFLARNRIVEVEAVKE